MAKKSTNEDQLLRDVLQDLEEDEGFQEVREVYSHQLKKYSDIIENGLAYMFDADNPARMDDAAVETLQAMHCLPSHSTVPLTLDVANRFRTMRTIVKDRALKEKRMVELFLGIARFKLPFVWSMISVVNKKGKVIDEIRLDGKHSSWLLCLQPGLIWPGEEVTILDFRLPATLGEDMINMIAAGLYRQFNNPASVKTNREIVKSGAAIADPRIDKAAVEFTVTSTVVSTLWAYSQKHNRARFIPAATKTDVLYGSNVDFLLMVSFLTRGADTENCRAIKTKACMYMMYYAYRIDPEAALAFWLTVRDGAAPSPDAGPNWQSSPTSKLLDYLKHHHLTTGDVKSKGQAQKKKAVPWDEFIGKIRGTWNNWCKGNQAKKAFCGSIATIDVRNVPTRSAEPLINREFMRELLQLINKGNEKEAQRRYAELQQSRG